MRERDADLRVDVRDEPGAVEAGTGSTPPQTYGMPRYCIAIPTTPPYCDGAARGSTDRCSCRWTTPSESTTSPAACVAACCARTPTLLRCCWRPARPRLRGELRLAAGLLGLELRDLALDRASMRCCSAICPSIALLLRSPARRRSAPARRAPAQLRPALLDLRAEPLDVAEDLRVLVADALDHVEAPEEVVEALGAEDDLDRAAAVAVDVERAEPLGDVPLRDAEALLRDDEMLRVRLRGRRRSASSWTFA